MSQRILEWRKSATLCSRELVLVLFLLVRTCESWVAVHTATGSHPRIELRMWQPAGWGGRRRPGAAPKKQTFVCSGGASWIPWEGSNRPIIETERDIVLKRERCALCSGTGKMSCRSCMGKGANFGKSRPLRLGDIDVGANERMIYDARTGLSRAVEAKPCKECGETGTISCKLCLGDGKRLDSRDYDGLKRMEEANVRLGIVDDESNQDP